MEEIKEAFNNMKEANKKGQQHQLKLLRLNKRWEHLRREKVCVMGYGADQLRTEVATRAPEINIVSGLFGPSPEEKEAEEKEKEKILQQCAILNPQIEGYNEGIKTSMQHLKLVLQKHQATHPKLWEAYCAYEAAGLYVNIRAGNKFIQIMNKACE